MNKFYNYLFEINLFSLNLKTKIYNIRHLINLYF